MPDYAEEIRSLHVAELRFRLASAVRLSVTVGIQPLDLPVEWTHGKHRVKYSEIAVTKDEADYAAWNLHQSATFLMAVAIKDAIRVAVPDPKTHLNADVRSAYQISRLIRNAFTHGPFRPVWSIDRDCRDQVFEVRDIIKLDTTGLHGQVFDWRQYGGPLALFRLSKFVRAEVLKESPRKSRVLPLPERFIIKQGDLNLVRVAEIPSGARKLSRHEAQESLRKLGIEIVPSGATGRKQ